MKDSPYPLKGTTYCALYSTFVRSLIISLIIRAVKYQTSKSTCACADSNTRNRSRHCQSGRRLLLPSNLLATPLRHPRDTRNDPTYNHILLQPYQVIALTLNRSLRSHPRGLLAEDSRRKAI